MDALDRMYQVLVRNVRERHPNLLNAPFTVAELYQQVLPYRHFRRELGLETNQEYEMVLMELLTGARGYLDVDERLRDQLGKEMDSRSPEPSRVRDFADAHVSLNPSARTSVTGSTPVPAAGEGSRAAESGGAQGDHTRCRYCGGELPRDMSGRNLNFCPHCGQNLQVLNCPACGAEVESGWKFCVVCGKSVANA